jgi:homoserine kinase type II
MAVYTALDPDALASLIDDYALVRVTASTGIPTGSVNTNYVLETPRGKHLLRIDEVKGELDVKRELDLLLFLRKVGFPCPQPLSDRKGRYYRDLGGKCVSLGVSRT